MSHRHKLLLALLVFGYTLFGTYIGLAYHFNFSSALLDLGVFDQLAWSLAAGEGFNNTTNFSQPINWLGFHFHPFMAAFAPLYWIASTPIWLLFAQALAVAASVVPVHLLALRVLGDVRQAWLWSAIYLLNPFLLAALAWDVHPAVFGCPFIACAFYALERRKLLTLYACLIPLLLIQEQFGLTLVGFALLWTFQTGTTRPVLPLAALGILHFVIVIAVLMPALSPIGGHPMLGQGDFSGNRYQWLGDDFGSVIANALLSPLQVASTALVDLGGAVYLLLLLVTAAGLSLLAPTLLLPAWGELGINLLSSNPMMTDPASYHSAATIPTLIVAAIYGNQRLSTRYRSTAYWTGWAMFCALLFSLALGPWPTPLTRDVRQLDSYLALPDPQLARVKAVIPDDAAVSAQANIGPHFTQRRSIYVFPKRLENSDVVVLRLASPRRLPARQRYELDGLRNHVSTLDSYLEMDRTRYLAAVSCVLDQKGFEVALWSDPWLVLSRQASPGVDLADIRAKIRRIADEWHIDTEAYSDFVQRCSHLNKWWALPR